VFHSRGVRRSLACVQIPAFVYKHSSWYNENHSQNICLKTTLKNQSPGQCLRRTRTAPRWSLGGEGPRKERGAERRPQPSSWSTAPVTGVRTAPALPVPSLGHKPALAKSSMSNCLCGQTERGETQVNLKLRELFLPLQSSVHCRLQKLNP